MCLPGFLARRGRRAEGGGRGRLRSAGAGRPAGLRTSCGSHPCRRAWGARGRAGGRTWRGAALLQTGGSRTQGPSTASLPTHRASAPGLCTRPAPPRTATRALRFIPPGSCSCSGLLLLPALAPQQPPSCLLQQARSQPPSHSPYSKPAKRAGNLRGPLTTVLLPTTPLSLLPRRKRSQAPATGASNLQLLPLPPFLCVSCTTVSCTLFHTPRAATLLFHMPKVAVFPRFGFCILAGVCFVLFCLFPPKDYAWTSGTTSPQQ